LPDIAAPKTAAAIDVETTGLDATSDVIIQFSLAPFTYDASSGKIFEVRDALTYFEDPGRPLPSHITGMTGIRDEDVAGKCIDDAAVTGLLAEISLLIAHNAAFDRPFVERRLPAFRDMPWACSMQEVPWKLAGMSSASLEYLLMKHCSRFYAAHRADNDALGLIHLLATPLADGNLPMSLLLKSARTKSVRIWAEGASIEYKDMLKARRYRWNPGADSRPRAWHKVMKATERTDELAWLCQNVYGGKSPKLRIDTFDARTRYSVRE
jgi:DNA polymerase-3 subunit epsilon